MTLQVLAESYRLFRADPWRFLLLSSVVVVPFAAAQWFAPGQWRDLPFYLGVIAYPLAQAAVADAVREQQAQRAVGLGSYLRVARMFVKLAVASVVAYICIFVGLILLIVPGLLAISRWSVFVPVIVNEPQVRTGVSSLARSNRLVRGHTWAGFCIFLLPLLPTVAISLPNLAIHSLALACFAIASASLVTAYGAIAGMVFYQHLTRPETQGARPLLDTEEAPPSDAEAARRRLWTS